jgi:hypothetical protein
MKKTKKKYAYKLLVGKHEEKQTHRREDNIKMDLKKKG